MENQIVDKYKADIEGNFYKDSVKETNRKLAYVSDVLKLDNSEIAGDVQGMRNRIYTNDGKVLDYSYLDTGSTSKNQNLQLSEYKPTLDSTMREWASDDNTLKSGTATTYFGVKGFIYGLPAALSEGFDKNALEPGANYDPATAAYERGKAIGTAVDVLLILDGLGKAAFGKVSVGSISSETNTGNVSSSQVTNYNQWPENDGFLGNYRSPEIAQPGQVISRVGNLNGSYVSPPGTSLSERGLSSNYPSQSETLWKVVEPVKYEGGIASPWKDASGMGTQYKLENSIQNLWDAGKVEPYGK